MIRIAVLGSVFMTAVVVQPVFAAPKGQPRSTSAPAMDCRVIASSGAMSLEACEAMIGSANRAQQALDRSSTAARPGDESMSCKALFAELKTMQIVPPSRAKIAEGQASSEALQAEYARIRAEGMAQYAKQTAVGTASVVAGAVGIPGVGEASAAAQQAQQAQQAQGARNVARVKPMQNRAIKASGAVIGDLATGMEGNPRYSRLMNLIVQKDCRDGF